MNSVILRARPRRPKRNAQRPAQDTDAAAAPSSGPRPPPPAKASVPLVPRVSAGRPVQRAHRSRAAVLTECCFPR
jgi:hypothetical protein